MEDQDIKIADLESQIDYLNETIVNFQDAVKELYALRGEDPLVAKFAEEFGG